MQDCGDLSNGSLAKFKQDVFAKLAFLGMPHGDVAALRHLWKVVNLSVRLGTDGAEKLATHPEVPKLIRALSKDLGAPRAGTFVKWLVEKVASLPPDQVGEGDADASEAANSAVAFLKQAGRDQKSESGSDGNARSSCSEKQPIEKLAAKTEEAKQALPDEAWVELKSKEGRNYYWDRRNNKCSWSLPAGVQARWVSHKSVDGRTYYVNHEGKSFWVMPALSTASEKGKRQPQEQCSKECRFLPELGLLKPLVLTPAPAAPSASCSDLGPFEAALEPETPVLPAALMVQPHRPIASVLQENLQEDRNAEPIVEEAHDASKSEKDVEAVPVAAVQRAGDEVADPTGLREEVLLLKQQLAELREKQAAVFSQARLKSEVIDPKPAEPDTVAENAASSSSRRGDDEQSASAQPTKHTPEGTFVAQNAATSSRPRDELSASAQTAKQDPEVTSVTSVQNKKQKKKQRQATKESESAEAPVEVREEERPLKRRRAVAHKSGLNSLEEEEDEAQPANTSRLEEDEWDSWSKTLDKLDTHLADKQKAEYEEQLKLYEEQQKMTDAYLSRFGTWLTDSESESEGEECAETHKRRATAFHAPAVQKKPRNAINFGACPSLDVQPDADSRASRSSSSTPCQAKSSDSHKCGRDESGSPEQRSGLPQIAAPDDEAKGKAESPGGEKAIDRFLTVVKYGKPPGNWGTPKSIEESSAATVFEWRNSRTPSIGGA